MFYYISLHIYTFYYLLLIYYFPSFVTNVGDSTLKCSVIIQCQLCVRKVSFKSVLGHYVLFLIFFSDLTCFS